MEKLKLKNIIKSLGYAQRQLKKDRKTGHYVPNWESGYSPKEGFPEKLVKSWTANSLLQRNKITITAALNLYHELRGSAYRHSVLPCRQYAYKASYERLRQSLTSTPITI